MFLLEVRTRWVDNYGIFFLYANVSNYLSHREFYYLLAFFDAYEIIVEKIYVEGCLKDPTENLGPAIEIIDVVSVDPIVQYSLNMCI